MAGKLTYKEAGVDTVKAAALVGDIRAHVQRTQKQRQLMGAFGLFAAAYELKGYRQPVIVTGCDGVGTKLEVQLQNDRIEDAGKDLVAMSVNDILTTGGDPLMFLDYIGLAQLDEERVTRVVAGMADYLEACGCILAGGETAEMPGVVPEGVLELSGFCIGCVEKEEMIDPSTIAEGDVVVGYASDGVHANGWSLVRRVLAENASEFSEADVHALLPPTRLYHDVVNALKAGKVRAKALAHITGGGLPENIERLFDGLGCTLEVPVWENAAVQKLLRFVDEESRWHTFNMGFGWVAIVAPGDVDAAVAAGPGGTVLGTIDDTPGCVSLRKDDAAMSDPLNHECGIAVVRLRKPLAYYQHRYKDGLWGFRKLFLLMEKQHNRGQDGVGIGCTKLDMPKGSPYIFRRRDAARDSLAAIFRSELKRLNKMARKGLVDLEDPDSLKKKFDFAGELLVGHLRYGTSGQFDSGSCHPYLRRSNWPTRTLMVMGNFNMTNARFLNQQLIERGQHPVFGTDTQTVQEEIGFHLDEAHTDIYRRLRDEGVPGPEIPGRISEELDLAKIVSESAGAWDGGYSICGVVGNGDLFVMRDPRGIRPCHVLVNDEVIAFASERVPLMTVFEAGEDEVKELEPGVVATVKSDGTMAAERFAEPVDPLPCSFERIYFSRGNDPSIYQERKALGAALAEQVVEAIDGDFDKSYFAFIPNTAETAYYGLMDGLRLYRRKQVRAEIIEAQKDGTLTEEKLDDLIMRNWPRGEKIAHKDIKMRTFISQEKGRAQLVSHVYDITYGIVKDDDVLVALDDSIVRGTTLKESILKMLARTNPRKIVVCSTAPQIRYPDCYGIDMSELGKFIAFQAAIRLLEKTGRSSLQQEVHDECVEELKKPWGEMRNCVQRIYEPFTAEEISEEISRMVYPEEGDWGGEVQIIFQGIQHLHDSIPGPCGDWYFTGNYPTPGGYATVNMAYVNWFKGVSGRSYDLPL